MSVAVVLGVCGAVLLATITQQVSGFGFALLAVPLMSLMVGPKDAVAIAFAAGAVSSGTMTYRLRDRIQRPVLMRVLLGAAFGLPIGVVGLRQLPEDPLRIGLAVVILAMVVILGTGYRFRSERPRTEVGAGFVSGILNGSLGTGGPPIVVVLQAAAVEQHDFRATTTAFFAICDVVALPLIVASGVASGGTWWAALATTPAVLVGTVVGERLAVRVERDRFRHLILALLVLAALSSIVAALR